jgi:ribosomal protein S18 acetylase RimI-like enzyme
MEDTLVIRPADIEDINAIGFLAYQTWPSTYKDILTLEQLQYMLQMMYSPAALQEQMLQKHHHFFIAEIDENEVGFTSYSETEPGTLKIHKIYVLPGLQGKGVGKALMDSIIEEGKEQGAKKIQLNVNRNNKAISFYERNGFKILKEENIDIGNGYFMNDFVMEKPI